jgi:AraC family transcriptional regulator of adaptative response/methylated-DNA-[protein]-cysteine methyltransferase
MIQCVKYGAGTTVLGEAVAFVTSKGICALRLLGKQSLPQIVRQIREDFADWEFVEDEAVARRVFGQVRKWLDGKIEPSELNLDLRGTALQTRVWRELLQVPHGKTRSYTEVAQRVGRPTAVRAVANACARNPVGLLVPCHRIVRQDGSLGGYYWGLDKKNMLLKYEQAAAAKNHV